MMLYDGSTGLPFQVPTTLAKIGQVICPMIKGQLSGVIVGCAMMNYTTSY